MKRQIVFLIAVFFLTVSQASAQFENHGPTEPLTRLPSFGPLPSLAPSQPLAQPPTFVNPNPPTLVVPPEPPPEHAEAADCDVHKQECETHCFPLPDSYSTFERCVRTQRKDVSENCLEIIVDAIRELAEKRSKDDR
jgi:hypothetical protein